MLSSSTNTTLYIEPPYLIFKALLIEGLSKAFPWDNYNCKIVGTAPNAIIGTTIIKTESPDILITDISMPNMTGLEMIQNIKKEFPNLQIIVLTAFRDFDFAREAVRLGVLRYLLKPSKMNELTDAIIEAIEKLDTIYNVSNKEECEDTVYDSVVVNNVISYIKSNYEKKLTLKILADEVYVSEWHLSRLLKKHTNKKISDLINDIRIEKAKELLKNPYLKINNIAISTGFNDTPNFSKVFKRQTGLTPNEYRKSLF